MSPRYSPLRSVGLRTGLGHGCRLACFAIHLLGRSDVEGQDVVHLDARHGPQRSPTPDPLFNCWGIPSGEVVFEITIWKANHERPFWDGAPLSTLTVHLPERFAQQTRRTSIHLRGDTSGWASCGCRLRCCLALGHRPPVSRWSFEVRNRPASSARGAASAPRRPLPHEHRV